VATGCEGGNVALIELAEGLASAHRNDKTSVTAVRFFSSLKSDYDILSYHGRPQTFSQARGKGVRTRLDPLRTPMYLTRDL
jgi:hypothetical protein